MAVLATEGPGAGAYHSKEEGKDRTRKYETGRDEAGAFLYPPRTDRARQQDKAHGHPTNWIEMQDVVYVHACMYTLCRR